MLLPRGRLVIHCLKDFFKVYISYTNCTVHPEIQTIAGKHEAFSHSSHLSHSCFHCEVIFSDIFSVYKNVCVCVYT
jgi:hypothetical protein